MEDGLLFEGLKVIDVGSWIAAPVCATMLADMGADVIKIEPPGGDAYRAYFQLPVSPNSEINYPWILDNHNKRSLTLNLKTEEGMAILKELVRDCDVYLTNQPLPLRRQLGLTYEDLEPLNERMVYGSLTAYGEEGPERDRESFDIVAYWSRSGLMNQMRHAGVEPKQAMGGMGDHPTGVAFYGSVVTALLRRERTGKGGKAHTSLLANGLWSASCWAQAAWAPDADFTQMPPQRLISAVYETADSRWIQFSMIRSVEEFDLVVTLLGHPEWLADERFATPEQRLENYAVFTDMLRSAIAQREAREWMAQFQDNGINVALVAEFTDLPEDPQVLANNMAPEVVDDMEMPRIVRDPINVDGVGRVGPKRAPGPGENSAEILAEMGRSDAEIERLREGGVI